MSFMDKKCAVILAAGEGTRMKSKKPKALAEVLFAPMIDWVRGAAKESGIDDICVRRETLLKATAVMSSF